MGAGNSQTEGLQEPAVPLWTAPPCPVWPALHSYPARRLEAADSLLLTGRPPCHGSRMDADSPSLKQPVSVAHLSPRSGTVDLGDSLENEEGGPRSPQDRVGADIGGAILTFPQPRPAGGGGEMKGSDKSPATQPHPSPRHLGAGGGVNGLLCASELKAIRCYLSGGGFELPMQMRFPPAPPPEL